MFAGLKSIRRERAELERTRVLFSAMLEGAEIQDTFDSVSNRDFFEGVSEQEIEDMIDKIPESDEEDEQVDRILASDGDMDIDKIFGIGDSSIELDD